MTKRLVGVISDTHGLVRPEAVEVLRDCELIIHSGDIGKPEVLQRLEDLAPVAAVRGNMDKDNWAKELPPTRVVQVDNILFYILHDLGELDLDPHSAGFHVVVSGHSHRPSEETKNGVLYVNPGSAGPRRFGLPVSLALITIEEGNIDVNFVSLID